MACNRGQAGIREPCSASTGLPTVVRRAQLELIWADWRLSTGWRNLGLDITRSRNFVPVRAACRSGHDTDQATHCTQGGICLSYASVTQPAADRRAFAVYQAIPQTSAHCIWSLTDPPTKGTADCSRYDNRAGVHWPHPVRLGMSL